jgi:radical SAM superfamily enzyme
MAKYRIVTDQYSGYEVQKRYLFIFWFQPITNTFDTIEKAKLYIEKLKNPFKSKVIYIE